MPPPSTATAMPIATRDSVALRTTAPFATPLTISLPPTDHGYSRWKPVLEGAFALAALGLFAPFFLLIGALVRLDSRGPALYSQVRVGRDRRRRTRHTYAGGDRRGQDVGGQPFHIIKFRSMRENAEAKTGAVWAQGHDDPRVTRFGRLMRASHIDELPQLLNVVRGEMSLVGPRPERPELFTGLAQEVPNYRSRTAVRPGVTGLAQVVHKYDASLDDVRRKVAFDLEYIETASFRTDLKIICGTALRCWDELCEAVAKKRRAPQPQQATPAGS